MTDSTSTPTHEQIARRAFEIFTERGQPEGQDLAHWLEAERQLRAASQPKGSPAQKSSPAQMSSTASASGTSSAPMRGTTPAPSNGRSNGRPRTAARK